MAKLAGIPATDRDAELETRPGRVPRLRTRYYAFLSYSHQDKELADWLHRELEKFRVPRSLAGKLTANGVVPRRLTPIFRDQQDLSAGGELADEIKAALAASQFLVVLCSPMAAKSRWTNEEIESFKRTRPEGCVLAAVANGEPFASDDAGREETECFPPALRFKYDRRGHRTAKRAEPLAADFRDGGEGKRMAFLKLVAGMLGVGLDELVRREQTRRSRRLAILAAGSLGGMAVTSTLAVAAFEARNEAREQRREAEGLVAFMVGDLKDKLEPIGRLDALDGVGSRVLAYYRKQDTSQLSDAALSQRSQALSITAQVAFTRGNYDAATRLYREAAAGTAEAIRRRPDDAQRLFDHAQNIFWIGDIARQRGETDKAEVQFREYLDLANRMVELQPDNLKWRLEVLYAREDLGLVQYKQRRFAEATDTLENALGPMQALASVDSSKIEYQQAASQVLAWIADVAKDQGQYRKATTFRQRQAAYLGQLIGRGAKDVAIEQDLVTSNQGLGLLSTYQGNPAEAVAHYRFALAQAEKLTALEPANSTWKDIVASVRLLLARDLLALGQRDEAVQQAAAGCAIANALRTGAAKVTRWHKLVNDCLSVQSRLALAAGDKGGALSFAQQLLASAQSGHSGDLAGDRHAIASAYLLLGDTMRSTGDSGAGTAWRRALDSIPHNVAETPPEMDVHAAILERLGRQAEAAPLRQRLTKIGYRRIS